MAIGAGVDAGYATPASAVNIDLGGLGPPSAATMLLIIVSASIAMGSVGAMTATLCVFFFVMVTTASI